MALRRLAEALAEYEIVGVATNVAFLQRVIAHDAFATAKLDTGLIARHHDALFPPPSPPSAPILLAAALAETLALVARADAAARASGDPHSPWNAIDPWWPNSASHALTFGSSMARRGTRSRVRRTGRLARASAGCGGAGAAVTSRRATGGSSSSPSGGVRRDRGSDGDERHVFSGGAHCRLRSSTRSPTPATRRRTAAT